MKEEAKDTEELIRSCSFAIQNDKRNIETALQKIGLITINGSQSLQVKKARLTLKKEFTEAIQTPNSPSDISGTSIFNKSVIKVKSIEESPSESQEDTCIKRGGYFQVSQKKC